MKNELLKKKKVFWSKFRWSSSPSKLEGHMRSVLEGFAFSWGKHHVHSILFIFNEKSNLSSCAQPSPSRKGKCPTYIVHHMWKILAFKCGSYIGATHGTTSQTIICQPNTYFDMLGLWGFYILFWPTW